MKKKVFVLFGGKSGEHEVSVKSALNVLNELNKEKYVVFALYITRDGKWTSPWSVNEIKVTNKDILENSNRSQLSSFLEFLTNELDEDTIVFPVLHGTYGEDGKVQGLLDMLNIAYVGNDVGASALAMDKIISKKVFSYHDIPQVCFVTYIHSDFEIRPRFCIEEVTEKIGYPCYVKPANMGSSIGINRCENPQDLEEAMLEAFCYDHKIVVEQEIIGREVLVALTGNESIRCSVAGEWKRNVSFFDYEDKYMDNDLSPIIPANITDDTYLKVCSYAETAYRALGCSGMLRADFFITETNEIYLNEVNTIPGFTQHSMFPLLVQKTEGCTYSELLDQLIHLGFLKHKQKNKLQYHRRTS
ncbi:D-alanine--D-alanine ligase family protein [Chengkuizengella marina]|uniref:D-alanine--D-alanine ligase n=1 Tax=Chengkuizengella marina TaxID=2507566 RepID=A0A6N9Q5L6_9BACL|nr:D-alanine--D-alanine ligase family protein [Chengkuizengella marina]NBI30112.1 D-alanine--D-alanine ligase [Chengkuizengella marina]